MGLEIVKNHNNKTMQRFMGILSPEAIELGDKLFVAEITSREIRLKVHQVKNNYLLKQAIGCTSETDTGF